jgi:hypothetical protein
LVSIDGYDERVFRVSADLILHESAEAERISGAIDLELMISRLTPPVANADGERAKAIVGQEGTPESPPSTFHFFYGEDRGGISRNGL